MISRRKQYIEDIAYRIYVTDALMGIAKNTSRGAGAEMSKRFYDVINTKEETRTADEIISMMKHKISGGGEHV